MHQRSAGGQLNCCFCVILIIFEVVLGHAYHQSFGRARNAHTDSRCNGTAVPRLIVLERWWWIDGDLHTALVLG
jgi:hypothetical protein